MSHRRNNTAATAPTRPPAAQRSYIVSIDAGAFANVEIVVGGYNRGGVWTPSRAASVKATGKSHVYAYGMPPASPRQYASSADASPPPSSYIERTTKLAATPSAQSTKPTPFSPVQSHPASARSPSSASAAWSKRPYGRENDRDYLAAQHRLAAEERARELLQRRREEARRAAAIAEEARRRRHAEQQRQEQQKRLQQLQQQQHRALRDGRRRMREVAGAWSSYEARWGQLSQRRPSSPGAPTPLPLTFERIPWPVADAIGAVPPLEPLDGRTRRTRGALDELLRPEAIREFLLSPAHSPDVSSKDRIRAALRRWHPDKFARVLNQVMDSDKDAVTEGMGIVVRCLNDMLERENHA